jgi:hypothetical protein
VKDQGIVVPTKCIKVQLKIVDLDVTGMKRLGFALATPDSDASEVAPGCVRMEVARGSGLPGFVEALEREKLATVATAPAIQVAEGLQASVRCQKLDTCVEMTATSAGPDRVRIHARPQIGKDGRPVDCNLEIKPGDTAVFTGTLSDAGRERQVMILVTPTPMVAGAEASPVNHEEPIGVPAGIRPFKTGTRGTDIPAGFSSDKPRPRLIFTHPSGGTD